MVIYQILYFPIRKHILRPAFEIVGRHFHQILCFMNLKKLGLISLPIIILFCCCNTDNNTSEPEKETTTTTNVDPSALAQSICDCSQPLLDLNKELETMKNEGKIEELTAMMEKAGQVQGEVFMCSQKHKTEASIDSEQLKKAIQKKCVLPEELVDKIIMNL